MNRIKIILLLLLSINTVFAQELISYETVKRELLWVLSELKEYHENLEDEIRTHLTVREVKKKEYDNILWNNSRELEARKWMWKSN